LTVLLIQIQIVGCGREADVEPVQLSVDRQLVPPTELIRTPGGDLVALVGEAGEGALTLYRCVSDGLNWERWQSLPAPEQITEVDLACGGSRLAVAASRGETIWVASCDADPQQPDDAHFLTTDFTAEQHVVSLAIAAVAPDADTIPGLHLAYLTGDPSDSIRVMWHRWSADGGETWSEQQRLGDGVLGRVALETQPGGGLTTDLGFSRERFMHWRGLSGLDYTGEFKVRLRVDHSSRNEIARLGKEVLVAGESHRHQVLSATSHNNGRNYEPATALGRDSDHSRVPDIDAGFGRFWVVYNAGDTLLVARTATHPSRAKLWSPGITVPVSGCLGEPSIVALPDSTAGILYAEPGGKVSFAKVPAPVGN
ncbi:hypothetical protein ACFL6M_02770, partial [Candidatus Eisenbacteria bacterium]